MTDDNMSRLVDKMHACLQKFCDATEPDECPLWDEPMRKCGKQCLLRDVEDEMLLMGFEVDDGD